MFVKGLRSPKWVKSAARRVVQLLPVCLNEQTIQEHGRTSHWGQAADSCMQQKVDRNLLRGSLQGLGRQLSECGAIGHRKTAKLPKAMVGSYPSDG